MAEIKILDTVPKVDSSKFPELPEYVEGRNYILGRSKWHHAEEENIGGALLTAMARKGEWHAVPWTEFRNLINNDQVRSIVLNGSKTSYYLHIVADTGDIEIVQVGEEHYLVPTPVFAKTLELCTISYY